MADRAVEMAAAGCAAVAVLGVDFMSENVRAVLDASGHSKVAVYRMAPERIGCSLADAAESDAYLEYLRAAATGDDGVATGTADGGSLSARRRRNLHVVYINTSLRTKAAADAVVPTITCTSGNVVQTLLQAFAQVCLPRCVLRAACLVSCLVRLRLR
jgi:quinolinate synthase